MSKRSLFVRMVPCRCLRGEEEAVTSLDYSHCSLETVPKEVFSFEKTLQELCLDANQIEELPKQLFNCQLLQRLSMPDNDLTVLPAAIANLVNLRELDVSKNSIQEFPENIKNCKVLAVVEASVNPISKLPEGFTQLLSLTQLYLNDAFLEFLPASFGRLTKLQILELRENQLKMLPKSMHKLTQLERLDLGSNEFTEVPEVLEQLTGIKELWMDGNRLTFLPGSVGMLKQLCYMDVSKNNLEMLDEQISGCENLTDLLLSNNALTQLPGSIGTLKKLSALKVDENQLMYLPDSIGGLTSLDELDCSFNEIEALPSSVGQCVNIRTFAADHNFLTQLPPEMGLWQNATVLFLHSNKLESLPEEMGDMTRLKVINLSDNRLKNLPYSFTKLSQMTAMWLSENQSKPLIPLQKEEDPETQKTVLTNYMFPQQSRTEEYIPNSDSESFNPSLWEEQRKQRAQVAFECDEDKDERETPPREGNLKRYPTPYPEELKNMVKTAQSVAHRLKEDEEESNREKNRIGVQDVGVKVIDGPCANGKAVEMESSVSADTCVQSSSTDDLQDHSDDLQDHSDDLQDHSDDLQDHSESPDSHMAPLKSSENSATMMTHEDTLEDSEELSDEEEEMKTAEMRPPLIEISINQPKVVTLSKEKKDDGKDADSLLDDAVANSNQNNSNCSSPSRMSDSVSLTTDSSQDNSLCTPERDQKTGFLPKSSQEDENMNQQPKESTPLLHNGNGSDTSLHALLKSHQQHHQHHHQQPERPGDYDLSMEARMAFINNSMQGGEHVEGYTAWDQLNMNTVSKLPTDNMVLLDQLEKTRNNGSVTPSREDLLKNKQGVLGSNNDNMLSEHLENGNQQHYTDGLQALSQQRGGGDLYTDGLQALSQQRGGGDLYTDGLQATSQQRGGDLQALSQQRGGDLYTDGLQATSQQRGGGDLYTDGLQPMSQQRGGGDLYTDGLATSQQRGGGDLYTDGLQATSQQRGGGDLYTDGLQPMSQQRGGGDLYTDGLQPMSQQRGGAGGLRHAGVSSTGVTACSDMSLSHSTEELSPEKRFPPAPTQTRSHSVTNIESGGMKVYSMMDGGGGGEGGGAGGRMLLSSAPGPGAGPQVQSIVRSKSASLLNEQTLQVYHSSSASSSDLLSSSSSSRGPVVSSSRPAGPSSMALGLPPPQYNIQYTSSAAVAKDGLWTHRAPVPPEHQGYLPPPAQHSLANTNYSNRNQAAPPYPSSSSSSSSLSRGPPLGSDLWSKDPRRGSSTLQRQSSSSSTASMGGGGEPRRLQHLPDGDYMTYRDIHTLGRGPLAMSHQALQRPLSARTYSMDVPGVSRPHSARPPPLHHDPHMLPERTMSVSDFNYQQQQQHGSPGQRPGAQRVKSEHSLLDGGVGARVPVDWRDQVMRHIEAKKVEKNAMSRSYNSTYAPLSCSQYGGSSRDMHASQGSLLLSARDGALYGGPGLPDDVFGPQGPPAYNMDPHRKVPLMNGQMAPPPARPSMSQAPPMGAPMARHPSREQLIDYLMLKVSHQQQGPQGPPRIPPHDTLQQEMRVKVEKNPELGFSISGGVGGRGNPFRPDDNGIFVTRVQPEGPASQILQPGDKIIQVNGYSFVNIDHGNAVGLLKTFPCTVDMIIVREMIA